MTPAPAAIPASRRRRWLAAILLLAAIVRVAAVLAVGPGIHVDEASNVWNAWCLASAGTDEHGASWPWLYTGAFGDNRSPLFLYAILPFHALLGPTPTVARWPAVLAGVFAVGAIAAVARRLFGDRVGLAAAAALAVSPWQIFASSWGHESTLCPALVFSAIALLLASGAPLGDAPAPPRPGRAFLAGLALGFACYGYGAIRLYVPAFLAAAILANLRPLRAAARDPAGREWLLAVAAGFGLAFLPLAYVHLVDPAINARANLSWAWSPGDAWPTRVGRVLARYPSHFSPRLLGWSTGDDAAQSLPRGFGLLHAAAVPPFCIGLLRLFVSARTSRSARLALVGLLTYPAGDLLNAHDGVNLLRSSPGLPWIDLIVGVGLIEIGARSRAWTIAAAAGLLAGASVFVWRMNVEFATDPRRWSVRTMDLRAACEWLRPRLDSVDAVVWTQRDTSFAYAPVLVYLGAKPAGWFADPPARSLSVGERFRGANLVYRAGKHRFLFDDSAIVDLPPRVAWITRPGERAFDSPPDAVVRAPDGEESLELRITHNN